MGVKIGSLDISAFKVGSDDCKVYLGDVLLYPQTVSYKLIAQYSDTSEYKVECNGNAVLTAAEVSAHTTPKSAMTSAVISACDRPTFKIGDNSFSGCTSLSSVILNEGITHIGAQAFMNTSSLRNITFPSTLTTFGVSQFRYSGIREISGIPSGVTFLPSGAFADCTSLTAATIPSSVTNASTNLFLRDTNLKEVHFQGTTPPTLGADAFKGCTALSKIYIPSCDSYDDYAANAQFSAYTDLIYAEDETKCKGESYPFVFKREHKGGSAYTRACDSSSATTLTTGMTRSGTSMSVISGTSKPVTAITVGDCTKIISKAAFSGWTKVSGNVIIADGVQEIGDSAFDKCGYSTGTYGTGNLLIGRGVTKIGSYAFRDNYFLSGVTLPGNTISCSSYTFTNCSYLKNITFKEGFNISVEGTSMFNGCSKLETLKLPNTLTKIYPSMFNKCESLTALTIGSGVTTIGSSAFYNHKINKLVIPDNVTSIDNNAFYSIGASSNFDSVKVGNGCTTIGTSGLAFTFKSIDIGSGITSIGNYGIKSNVCTTIICRATTPPTCGGSAFVNTKLTGIYVPDGSVNAYKSASFWSMYSDKIHPLSDLPS